MSKDKADKAAPADKKEKALTQPNNDQFNGHIKKLREEIRKIENEMDVLKARREELKNDKGKDELSMARRACGDVVKQIRALQDERKVHLDKRSELDAERKEIDIQQKDLAKSVGGRPMDRDELEREIKKIENAHETSGGMNLKRERNMLHKLQDLKKNYAAIDENQNLHDDMKSKRAQMQELVAKASEIQGKVDELRTELSKKQDHLKSLEGRANPGADIPKKMNDLWAKKKEFQQKIRDDSNAHQEKWTAWKEFDQEKRKKDREEREKRNASRKLERDAEDKERRKIKNEGKRLNPHEPELDTISTLIAYLSRLAGIDTRKEGGKKDGGDKKAPAKDLPAGFEIKKKEEDDKGGFGLKQKKGGKGPGAKKAPVNKVITHSMEKYSSFHKLNLEIPNTVAQIPETLEKLKEKKKHFESFIKSQAEVDAEDEIREKEREEKIARGEAVDDDDDEEAVKEEADKQEDAPKEKEAPKEQEAPKEEEAKEEEAAEAPAADAEE